MAHDPLKQDSGLTLERLEDLADKLQASGLLPSSQALANGFLALIRTLTDESIARTEFLEERTKSEATTQAAMESHLRNSEQQIANGQRHIAHVERAERYFGRIERLQYVQAKGLAEMAAGRDKNELWHILSDMSSDIGLDALVAEEETDA
jgi:hypothetical protein